jgi:hypothetical protein
MRSILLQRCIAQMRASPVQRCDPSLAGSRAPSHPACAEAGRKLGGSWGSEAGGEVSTFSSPARKGRGVTKPGSRFFPWEQVLGEVEA